MEKKKHEATIGLQTDVTIVQKLHKELCIYFSVFYKALIAMETVDSCLLHSHCVTECKCNLNCESYYIDSLFMFHKVNRSHKIQN